MTAEALWYGMFHEGRYPPRCGRLSFEPFPRQAEFSIALAIGLARGTACYRKVHTSSYRESYWYDGEGLYRAVRPRIKHAARGRPLTNWWLVPPRIERAIFALYEAAVECQLRAGDGHAALIARRLEAWRRNGHWRHVAAAKLRSVFQKPTKPRRKEAARRDRVQTRIAELYARFPRYELARADAEECDAGCDNGHRWPSRMGDVCPICGEYWT